VVRHGSAKPLSPGSNPGAASIQVLKSCKNAGVAELADAHDSKSCSFWSVGSTPTTGTITYKFIKSVLYALAFLFTLKAVRPSYVNLFLVH
jgi:hypothetical protein